MSRLSQDVAQQILSEHNCVRSRYGSAPLEWSWDLASDAQVHADRCGFWHSSAINQLPEGQGENLSISTGTVGTNGWVEEESAYDCNTGNCSNPPCGHWTQMIWNDTERVGCAIQRCTNGTVTPDGKPAGWIGSELLVCRYSPPGNYKGQQPVGSTQCAEGAKNSGCGDTSKQPKVSASGRGVGTIAPEGTAATTAAGASRFNQSGLPVWSKNPTTNTQAQAASLNVPLSIVDLAQTNGQKLFPWRTAQRIVSQYTPEDIKYFMDTYARDQAQIDSLTYRDVVRAIVQIEQRRKARGNIFVRDDQRALLDKLPPQHLSPLLTLLQGLPTFYHAALVDRFFKDLGQGVTGGASRIASGQEQLSTDQSDIDFAKSINAASGSTGNTIDTGTLNQQENELTQRFQGQISDASRAETERISAAVTAGTATAQQSMTSAYVVDAAQAEKASVGTILLNILVFIAGIILLLFITLVIYALVKGMSVGDAFTQLKTQVRSSLGV